jgi:hypothetical protein
MPANIGNLTVNRAHLERHFEDGSSLFIDYRPAQVTPRQLHKVQDMQQRNWDDLSPAEQNELMDSTVKMLADCLIDWDLLDRNNQPIPPTLEGLQDVDYLSQVAILEMIVEDQRLGKPNGNGQLPASSTDTSASPPTRALVSHPSQNSTLSEPLPNGSASAY